jgi:hypothetical protein
LAGWRSNACIVRSAFSSTWGLVVMAIHSMSAREAKILWDRFYYLYGNAMVGWSGIEKELATLFVVISGIKPAQAMQIMFAVKSGFPARKDIFVAVLSVSDIDPGTKEIVGLVLDRVGKYTQARNALAHDHPEIDWRKGSKSERQVILVHGRGFFQSDKVRAHYSQQALTMDEMQEITANFRELGKIIYDLWGQLAIGEKTSLDKYRERVSALPENPRLRATTKNPPPSTQAP